MTFLGEDFSAIIDSFIESSSNILDAIPPSLLNDDIDSFVIKIHSLKGSCRNIGAESLAELFMQYESNAKHGDIDKIDPSLTDIKHEFELVKTSLINYQSSH